MIAINDSPGMIDGMIYRQDLDKMNNGEILVIDLFAGPGGLGEGFSSCTTDDGNKPFRIGVSVEKELGAHTTLTTRSLYRKLVENKSSLNDYYRYVRGEVSRAVLMEKYPQQAKEAVLETLLSPKALGEDNALIHARIAELVEEHKGPKVVIGGPPCQAYSMAGRSRNAGNVNYKAEDDHRHYLYKEYLEVIAIAQPEVFVMENVRGILSAKINNELMFPQILADLRQPGQVTKAKCNYKYKIYSLVKKADDESNPNYKSSTDFLIKSEKYGIPQARHRVILLGVREDIKKIPEILTPALEKVTVKDTIEDLPPLRSGFSKQVDNAKEWEAEIAINANRLKNIFSTKKYDQKLADLDLVPIKNLSRKSNVFFPSSSYGMPKSLEDFIIDRELNFVLNHEARGHMKEDLLRYAFCSSYAFLNNGISPKSKDFPNQLAPSHKNWETGSHADRFRVQSANKYATTVTSHISKDGHYFIHYDPKQCRSLTVREAARLQTFPDNYLFEGNRTQQYVQVGNAVPPYLANQISKVVLNILKYQ